MQLLSDDDLNLRDLSDEELDRAWDLWFDLAQTTNDHDPPFTHGVFILVADEVVQGESATGGRPTRPRALSQPTMRPIEPEERCKR